MITHNGTPVTEVVLHTAALGDPHKFLKAYDTPEKQRDAINQWHLNRGWSGIGYHAVLGYEMRGNRIVGMRIVNGRPLTSVGAHVKGYNTGRLGLCMLNIRPHDGITKFEDYFPSKAKDVAKEWIKGLPGITKVSGHNDYTNLKECPGFKVDSSEWLEDPQGFWSRVWSYFH